MGSFRLDFIRRIYAPWFTNNSILFLVGRRLPEEEFRKKISELIKLSSRVGRRIQLRDVYEFLDGKNHIEFDKK